MSKPKKRKALSIAEKAVRQAVAEQTQELRAELEAEKRKVEHLQNTLKQISAVALNALPAGAGAPPKPGPAVSQAAEPQLPEGERTELAPGDQMGEGRWA